MSDNTEERIRRLLPMLELGEMRHLDLSEPEDRDCAEDPRYQKGIRTSIDCGLFWAEIHHPGITLLICSLVVQELTYRTEAIRGRNVRLSIGQAGRAVESLWSRGGYGLRGPETQQAWILSLMDERVLVDLLTGALGALDVSEAIPPVSGLRLVAGGAG